MNGRGSRQIRHEGPARQGSIHTTCLTAVDYGPVMATALQQKTTPMACPVNGQTLEPFPALDRVGPPSQS